MPLTQLFAEKTLQPKERTEKLSVWLLERTVPPDTLVAFAAGSKDPVKATCIESLEYVSKTDPEIITANALHFVLDCLCAKTPRVKWESARVIGNCIHLFPDDTKTAAQLLLANTQHPGTVVRWSAAYALGQILKLNTPHNKWLVPEAQAIASHEEKNSIRKIYLDALKKIKAS
jgi:HEAT repeat protein